MKNLLKYCACPFIESDLSFSMCHELSVSPAKGKMNQVNKKESHPISNPLAPRLAQQYCAYKNASTIGILLRGEIFKDRLLQGPL